MARLARIVVKEVSLVDKAANKRKFLFAKREEEISNPEDLLKILGENLDRFAEMMKAASSNENPKLAELAKEVLNGRMLPVVSLLSEADREALFKSFVPAKKSEEPKPKEEPPKEEQKPDEDDLSAEDIEAIKVLDKTIDSIKEEIKAIAAQ